MRKSSMTSIATQEGPPTTLNYDGVGTVLQIIVFPARHIHDLRISQQGKISSLTLHDDDDDDDGFSQYRTCTFMFSGRLINFFLCSDQQKKIFSIQS